VILVEANGGGRHFQNELPLEESDVSIDTLSSNTVTLRSHVCRYYLALRQRFDELLEAYPRALDLYNPHPDDKLATALKTNADVVSARDDDY
jgi:hypothetical protein